MVKSDHSRKVMGIMGYLRFSFGGGEWRAGAATWQIQCWGSTANLHPSLLPPMGLPTSLLSKMQRSPSLRFLSCNQGGHGGQFWPWSTVLFIQHWSELDLHHGKEGASEPLSWIAICGHTIKFGFDHHKSWGCRGGGVYICCQIVSDLVQHSDLPSKL